MNPLLVTERLAARSWAASDLDAAYDIYSRPEVTRWLDKPFQVRDRDHMAEKLTRWAKPSGDVTYGFWAVTMRDGGRPIGGVLLRPLPGGEDVEVGWHLHPDHWGQGYATEIGRVAARRAFDTGIEEVFAVVRPGNTYSGAVARRLGMDYVGRTEKYFDVELELYRLRPGDLT